MKNAVNTKKEWDYTYSAPTYMLQFQNIMQLWRQWEEVQVPARDVIDR